ncbi:transmembrane protein 205 [Sitophilus oryzae]|uniref:Transmembrane protein 205 n=1 Tax=Sitophilus oryzae TaxID=7048 RepID=A0A6J2Y0B3_SITOR|nr:transmembrane protein 205 [Sitophilus oryzae]
MCVGHIPSEKTSYELPSSTTTTTSLKELASLKNVCLLSEKKDSHKEYTQDILAVMTYWTKVLVFMINDYIKSFQSTKAYRIITSTTQPAHFVVTISVLYLAYIYLSNKSTVATISPVWTLLYLGSFSAHFGAQIWMTFISGLSLYFSLPRHTFGSVQKVLFPRYFLLNSMLSMVTLAIFLRVKTNELKNLEIGVQAFAMSFCFLIELLIFLYLVPPLTALISSKTAIEKEAGTGMEVGQFELGKLHKCPHYIKILKAFRKVHMTVAIGNMCALGCTSLHLYYLACKLCALSI